MANEKQERVQEYILRSLAAGELAAGEKLPAERELAERLGTTRAAVRKALDVLEARSHVTRHVGRGTFVAKSVGPEAAATWPAGREAGPPVPAFEVDASPAELIQARQLFEPHVAQLVVLAASESDVKELRRIAETQRELPVGARFEDSDILFHATLARATHNELVVAMAQLIARARKHPDWLKLKDVVARRNGGVRSGAVDEHLEIVAAIEARNSEEAGAATRRHLERVRQNLLGT